MIKTKKQNYFSPVCLLLIAVAGIHFSAVPVTWLNAIAPLALILMIFYAVYLRIFKKEQFFKNYGYEFAFALLSLAALLSIISAYIPAQAFADLLNILASILVFYLLAVFIKKPEDLRKVLNVLLIGFCVFLFCGLYQYAFSNWPWVAKYFNLPLLNSADFEARGLDRISSLFLKRSGANVYAGYLALFSPLFLTLLIDNFRQAKWGYKLLTLSIVVFWFFNVFYSLSRGLFIALTATLLLIVLSTKYWKQFLALVTALFVIGLLTIAPFQKTVFSLFNLKDISNQDHMLSLKMAVQQIHERPLLGWGGGHVNAKLKFVNGHWENWRGRYNTRSEKTVKFVDMLTIHDEALKDGVIIVHSPHNIYLFYFLDYGILGFVAILFLFFTILKKVNRVIKYSKDQLYLDLAYGAKWGILSFMVYCLFQDSLKSTILALFFFIFMLVAAKLEEFALGLPKRIKNKALILAYHRVLPADKTTLAVLSADLEKQIKYLMAKKYMFVTLEDYYKNYVHLEKSIKQKLAVLTFDDGYADNYLYAYPILKKYKIPATVFLTVDYIGRTKPFYWDLKNKTKFNKADLPMTWAQIKVLKKSGWEFGSHTLSHFELPQLEEKMLLAEIKKSKQIIDKNLKQKTVSFCYPRGNYSPELALKLKKAGYKVAVVTPAQADIQENDFALKRVGLYAHDDMFRFWLKTRSFFSLLKNLFK